MGCKSGTISDHGVASMLTLAHAAQQARQLGEEKEYVRALEEESHDAHLARLRQGTAQSIATSDIHLGTVRALKEINSRFITFAYPILKKSGLLLDSRLADVKS